MLTAYLLSALCFLERERRGDDGDGGKRGVCGVDRKDLR